MIIISVKDLNKGFGIFDLKKKSYIAFDFHFYIFFIIFYYYLIQNFNSLLIVRLG